VGFVGWTFTWPSKIQILGSWYLPVPVLYLLL
jgi:hypothetical protein